MFAAYLHETSARDIWYVAMFLDANKYFSLFIFKQIQDSKKFSLPEENTQFFSSAHGTSGLQFSQDEDTCVSVPTHELGVLAPSSAKS